jgi:hypothetical protein
VRTCERCGAEPEGNAYALHDYCAFCSKNLCPRCMEDGTCSEAPNGPGRHEPERADDSDEATA